MNIPISLAQSLDPAQQESLKLDCRSVWSELEDLVCTLRKIWSSLPDGISKDVMFENLEAVRALQTNINHVACNVSCAMYNQDELQSAA